VKIELDRKEAWYIHALVAREKYDVEYSNKIHRETFGKDSDEFTDEIKLCDSILNKLDPLLSRGRINNEMCEV